MKKYLTKMYGDRCQTFEARDGLSAFQLVTEKEDFDLIITDRHMPNCDGIEFIQLLAEYDFKSPIIMCTTERSKEKVKETLRLNISDYLIKPYSYNSFKSKISESLSDI